MTHFTKYVEIMSIIDVLLVLFVMDRVNVDSVSSSIKGKGKFAPVLN
jgi:hypothetical protein